MEELDFTPVADVQKKNLQHVLSNSFGFGGNDSALVFSKNF
jgi:3-oxoacyl-[acyl-carrier-protein] synthase-1